MRIWRDPAEVPPAGSARVVTIGAFDGVHLGHQAVLRLVRELAMARGLVATVLTFDRHPAEVVRPESAPCLLTDLDQKLALLEATGAVDDCLVLTFDATRSKEPAETFVEEVLAGALRARLVVVGADFHFGYRRRGNVPLLQQMGTDLGFEVLGLGLVATPDGGAAAGDALPYSSTRVRTLLGEGRVDEAVGVLGRAHAVPGTVVPDGADGAAFVVPARPCLPAPGSYRVRLRLPDGTEHAAIVTRSDDPASRSLALVVEGGMAPGPAMVLFGAAAG